MYFKSLKQDCSFKGRASRSEFWGWILGVFVIVFALPVLGGLFSYFIKETPFSFPKPLVITGGILLGLAIIFAFIYVQVRTYALMTRRLHDIGWSGWWVFADFILACIGFVGIMVFLVIMAVDMGERGDSANYQPTAIVVFFSVVLTIFGWLRQLYSLFLLVLCCLKSQSGENKYGVKPFV